MENIIDQSETTLKPTTFARGVGCRFLEANEAEFEIAAEPVPVRRPGVWTLDTDEVVESSWTGSVIGRTNVGSNLRRSFRGQGERGAGGKLNDT